MRRLAAVLAVALAAFGGWELAGFAQEPAEATAQQTRAAYIQEMLKQFHFTVGGSYIGREEGGDLLQLVSEEAEAQIAKDEDEGAPPVIAEDDLEVKALRSFDQLVSAYALKQRTRFMKNVADTFPNSQVLEEAIMVDFRAYDAVNLNVIVDHVTINGPEAVVDFKYDMGLLQDGKENKFSGRTSFHFRADADGKVKLSRMDDQIFGNSLPANQMPVSTSQGTPVNKGGTTPGQSSKVLKGKVVLVQGSRGLQFSTGALVPESAADLVKLSTDFTAKNGIVDIGPCTLSNVSSVPSRITGKFARIGVGTCYAMRTVQGKYAVFRTESVTETTATVNYIFQSDGSTQF